MPLPLTALRALLLTSDPWASVERLAHTAPRDAAILATAIGLTGQRYVRGRLPELVLRGICGPLCAMSLNQSDAPDDAVGAARAYLAAGRRPPWWRGARAGEAG